MEYTPQRVLELIREIDWKTGDILRIFWVRHPGPRGEFAQLLKTTSAGEAVVPLIVRNASFLSSNAVLADVNEILLQNESEFKGLQVEPIERVTVVLLAKDEFRLAQGSSPIELPDWFPVLPGKISSFHISDLGIASEERMLDCPEARIESVCALLYGLEAAIVTQLENLLLLNRTQLKDFLETAHAGAVEDIDGCVMGYRAHLVTVNDPRGYRPSAASDATSLASRLLKLTLNSSPKHLGACAKKLSLCFSHLPAIHLKQTFFAVMLRPAAKMDGAATNWHSILLAFYQAYQLTNGAAHGGEYPKYSVALQYANSLNLRTFLTDARNYLALSA